MSRPPGDRSGTRAAIVAAARELFADCGYASTSLRDIAERLGLSKAALHHYFPSKDALLDALIEPALQGLEAVGTEAPEPPLTRAQRRTLLTDYLAALREAGRTMQLLDGDPAAMMRPHLKERAFEHLARLEFLLAGPDPDLKGQLRARAAIAVLHAAAFQPPGEHGQHSPGGLLDLDPSLEAEAVDAALDVLGPVRRRTAAGPAPRSPGATRAGR